MRTKASIIDILETNPKAVEHAVTALQAQQTADEQSNGTTVHSNGRGWNAREASFAGSLAKWIASGRHLTRLQLNAARKMCIGHAGQLATLGTFPIAPSSILGIEERFYRPLDRFQVEREVATSRDQAAGMHALIADFDPFYNRIVRAPCSGP